MRLVRQLLLIGALSLFGSGVAFAVPVIFTLDSIVVTGATFPVVNTLAPSPVVGSGDLDLGGLSSFSLPTFNTTVNLSGSDAAVITTGISVPGDLLWEQNGVAIIGGEITPGLFPIATTGTFQGTNTCVGVALVCDNITDTTPWGPSPGLQVSVIDTVNSKIIITQTPPPVSGIELGTRVTTYSYSIVPEPTTALLMGLGFVGLGFAGRSRRV